MGLVYRVKDFFGEICFYHMVGFPFFITMCILVWCHGYFRMVHG